jgi:hypothetical protein
MNRFIEGSAHAIVGGLAGNKLDKATSQSPYLAENGQQVHSDIQAMVACLQYLCHKAEDEQLKPIYQPIMLQPGTLIPMHNERTNRLYNMALVATSTSVQFKVPGLGQPFALTLAAGWNVLNMPDYTEWGLPSAAPNNVSVIYCASNSVFGTAI